MSFLFAVLKSVIVGYKYENPRCFYRALESVIELGEGKAEAERN